MTGTSKIYLVGFMGCGKTTAGQKLAAELNCKFTDLDKLIEKKLNKPIPLIFSEMGEDHFRKVESEMLRSLNKSEFEVVSVGGGAPCFSGNMDYMKSTGIVIYLRMNASQLKDRLEGTQGKRPLLKGLTGKMLLHFIEEKLAEREKYYMLSTIIDDGFNPDILMLARKIRKLTKS